MGGRQRRRGRGGVLIVLGRLGIPAMVHLENSISILREAGLRAYSQCFPSFFIFWALL